MKIIYLGIKLFLTLHFGGCGKDEPVIARIRDAEITTVDFKHFVDNLPPELRSEKQGREATQDYLDSMVDQELLLLEARDRGIDASAAVTSQLQDLVMKQLASRYRAQIIAPRIKIGREDIERTFVELGFNRERLYSRILLYTQEEVEEVLPVWVRAHDAEIGNFVDDQFAWKQVSAEDRLALTTTSHLPCAWILTPGWYTVPMPRMALAIFEESQQYVFELVEVWLCQIRKGSLQERESGVESRAGVARGAHDYSDSSSVVCL